MDQQNIVDFCDLVVDHLKERRTDISLNEKFKTSFNNTPVTIVSGISKNNLINNLLLISPFDTDRANLAIILKALPPDHSQSTRQQSFVYENHVKKNKTPVSRNRQNSKLSYRSNNNSTLGLEESDGSPLKLRAYADLSDFDSTGCDSPVFITKEPTKHRECGIAARHARYLLSMYSNGLSQKCLADTKREPGNEDSNMPSLAILCDTKDLKRIACLCIEPLVRKIENCSQPVGIRSSIITLHRTGGADNIPPIIEDLSGRQINYEAQYDIFGGGRDDKLQTEYRGSMILELKWNKSGDTVTLLRQPPMDAQSVVKAQVSSGDMRSAAYVFFKELSVLSSIVSGINDAEVCWHTDQNEKPLAESIRELLEQLKMGDARPTTEMDQNKNDLSLVFENLLFDTRKDLDFTDYLWQVLQKCSAYTELVECLDYVLTVLDNGELQPMVHKTNTTTLARLVRDSYEGKMNKPCLVGLFPLQILAEIGIKKLRHDYINTFVSNDLATLAHLDKYVLPDKTTPLSTSLESLEKLHNILEMVTMLKLFVNIPHATLSSIVRQMLKHYESNYVEESHVFTFAVPTESVAEILKNSSPCMWKMTAVKLVEGFSDNISYILSSKQPFLHLPLGEDNGDISCTKESNSDIQYYFVKRQDNVAVLV